MGSRTHISPSRRTSVYYMFDGHCAYCGKELKMSEMEIDHIVPYIETRNNDLDNLFPSCVCCNVNKSTLSIDKFRTLIYNRVIQKKGKLSQIEFYANQSSPIKFYYETIKGKSEQYGN